jgi:hypothetical protein
VRARPGDYYQAPTPGRRYTFNGPPMKRGTMFAVQREIASGRRICGVADCPLRSTKTWGAVAQQRPICKAPKLYDFETLTTALPLHSPFFPSACLRLLLLIRFVGVAATQPLQGPSGPDPSASLVLGMFVYNSMSRSCSSGHGYRRRRSNPDHRRGSWRLSLLAHTLVPGKGCRS